MIFQINVKLMFEYNFKDKQFTLFKYSSYQTVNIYAKRRIKPYSNHYLADTCKYNMS